MDKYINRSEINGFLEESEFLYKLGYGKGIPVYSSFGIHTIERFIETFKMLLLENNIYFYENRVEKLIDKDYFHRVYLNINEYTDENILFNNDYIMSDALISNLRYLMSESAEEDKSVFSSSAIFRYKTSKLIPLYKDRYIYPVVQLDRKVKGKNVHAYIEQLKHLYLCFFREIGIDIFFLEAEEVPYYAKYELYFITGEGNGCFTKLGMVYVLSDEFKKNLGVSLDEELVDSGFSGRTLFKSIENTSLTYGKFMIHPNVTPIDFMYSCTHEFEFQPEIVASKFALNAKRYSSTKLAYRQWKKSGIPFYILFHDAVSLFFLEKESGYNEKLFQDIYSALDFLLNKKVSIVQEVLEKSQHLLNFSKQQFVVHSCRACHKDFFYGFVYDNKGHHCLHCGREIEKTILNINPTKRFY
ncbi:hypothetical protein [Xenorhabdus sp. Sc-CR9]|uniref:hypothetical protein n=1 Tax=Xenorhabdus sp. Sc-CR9 TaxID=2584468 RepID=UPI001F3F80A0|nr:hypothetical protein [Xenorhabdus sp. Sc-CR9]